MWQYCNSVLHETTGRLLIVESNMNKQVIQAYKAGAYELLAMDLPIIHIPLALIISGTITYKQQWLESMAVARVWFKKKQSEEQQECQFMENWARGGLTATTIAKH